MLADGFYEWGANPTGGKTPIRFTLADGGPFAFGGIWQRWVRADGTEVRSCCILTARPNALVQPVHNRMPVILRHQFEALWLDESVMDPEALAAAFEPCPTDEMTACAVSTRVNSTKFDDADARGRHGGRRSSQAVRQVR